jgi:hypothetical protein
MVQIRLGIFFKPFFAKNRNYKQLWVKALASAVWQISDSPKET